MVLRSAFRSVGRFVDKAESAQQISLVPGAVTLCTQNFLRKSCGGLSGKCCTIKKNRNVSENTEEARVNMGRVHSSSQNASHERCLMVIT